MNFMLKLILFYKFIVLCSTLDCMGQNNQPVDWFLVYKIPQINHTDELINNGLGYVYMTSKNPNWVTSEIAINSTESILAHTLSNLTEISTSYILYNDAPPSEAKNTKKGLSKGVVAFNGRGGYWMTHSLPNFPTYGSYKFPESGIRYGHMFFCVSVNLPQLNEVGHQLRYNEPNIYKSHIASDLKSVVPKLDNVRKPIVRAPWLSRKFIFSKKNKKFISFAKAGKDYRALYSDIIAPTLKQDLLVQNWPLDSKRYKSDCRRPTHVKNVNSVYINEAGASFYSNIDQSKWAITTNESSTFWFCIADVDRTKNAGHRSCGAICFGNKMLKKAFENLITGEGECQHDEKSIHRTNKKPVKKIVKKIYSQMKPDLYYGV